MANLDTQAQDRDNLSQYDQVKRQASSLVSQATQWQGTYNTLHSKVSAESKTILEAKHAAFISQMKAALGL